MRVSKKIKYRRRRTLKRVRYIGGSNKIVKLFDLDLHPSVIEDVKSVINNIYPHNFDITIWSLAEHAHQYGRKKKDIKHINESTWKNINMDMIKKFQDEYDTELNTFDGFIVTHSPVFAMIYEKYNKPILIINSCRYDQPFCWNKDMTMLNLFKDSLKRMQNSKQATIISNNKADQDYLKRTGDIDSIYIPSLCMYTNETYSPTKNEFVYFENVYLKNSMQKFKSIPNSNLLVNRPKNYTFKDLYSYKGIVHLPYDISSMALFEQYFAGVPLFFPSKKFYKECIQNNTAPFIVRYDTWTDLGKNIYILPSHEIDIWLKGADYYNFKYINYYDSFEDCINIINLFKDKDKDNRLIHIKTVKDDALKQWKSILNNIFHLQSGGMKQENECKYISTRGILKSCNIYSTDLYNKNFATYNNFLNIKDNDTIYVRFDNLKEFINKFNIINNKIILVIGDGDETFPDSFFDSDEKFINFIENPNIIHIFAINVNKTHSKLTPIPIGLNYHTLAKGIKVIGGTKPEWGATMTPEEQDKEIEEIRNKGLPFSKRSIKCYSNFHFNMQRDRIHTQDRHDAKEQIPEECIYYEPKHILRKETYLKQLEYAFVVCPHGNGLDCHRQWEALVLGCIPIVKSSSIDILYDDLPVLIVKEWSDINNKLLQSTIHTFKNKQFNYNKLNLVYWMSKVNSFKI